MTSNMIAALAAILGSIVGALGSAVATSITQRHQDRRDLLSKTIVRRESLYSDFISESARLIVDAMEHNSSEPQKLVPVYGLLAEEVVRTILASYRQPNLTTEQIESRALSAEDPLRVFSDTCRIELESLQRQL
jgi:hypothetical protein